MNEARKLCRTLADHYEANPNNWIRHALFNKSGATCVYGGLLWQAIDPKTDPERAIFSIYSISPLPAKIIKDAVLLLQNNLQEKFKSDNLPEKFKNDIRGDYVAPDIIKFNNDPQTNVEDVIALLRSV